MASLKIDEPSASGGKVNAKTILIVDDSAFARRRLRQMLEEAGCTVEEAASGAEALEKYSLRKPAAVLLDVVTEGLDGLEVLTRLRTMDPAAKVVMATADVQSATRNEAAALGASGFVNKPVNPEELLAILSRLTGDNAV